MMSMGFTVPGAATGGEGDFWNCWYDGKGGDSGGVVLEEGSAALLTGGLTGARLASAPALASASAPGWCEDV
jgi:hypothetical protein